MADVIDLVAEYAEKDVQTSLARIRNSSPAGESLIECEDCGDLIPENRRQALPGVRTCVAFQEERERWG